VSIVQRKKAKEVLCPKVFEARDVQDDGNALKQATPEKKYK